MTAVDSDWCLFYNAQSDWSKALTYLFRHLCLDISNLKLTNTAVDNLSHTCLIFFIWYTQYLVVRYTIWRRKYFFYFASFLLMWFSTICWHIVVSMMCVINSQITRAFRITTHITRAIKINGWTYVCGSMYIVYTTLEDAELVPKYIICLGLRSGFQGRFLTCSSLISILESTGDVI